jgi:hypothetical protein
MAGAVPANPAIFHITHITNLRGMIGDGYLWSDGERTRRRVNNTNIGYDHIKARRLRRVVPVSIGGTLGEYVPFYFCSRSVMLYVVHRGHDGYSGGQDQIVHLVSSVATATRIAKHWAFTDRHAELGYAEYFESLDQLKNVDWSVMPERQWGGNQDLKERRQAEFLVHQCFPWAAIERIVVRNEDIRKQVHALTGGKPAVEVQSSWYYD